MMGLMVSEETGRRCPPPYAVPPRARTPDRTPRAWATRLVTVGIVLTALNLRPAITSFGALLQDVRDGLGMSGSVAGLLTSVPRSCFAVFGVMAPRLARRFGPGAVVCAGMVAITAGLAIRPYTGSAVGFLAASALALMGIAVSNVLMPVIVKRWFPDRVGSMTGLYSMALALGTSAAAAVTVPVTDGSWWRLGSRASRVWRPPAAAGPPWIGVGRAPGADARRRASGHRPADPALAGNRTDRALPAAGPPGRSPSSSDSRPPPRTSRWAGWRRSSATRRPRGHRGPAPRRHGDGRALAFFVILRLATRMPTEGRSWSRSVSAASVDTRASPPRPRRWSLGLGAPVGVSNCASPALTMVGTRARTGAGVAQLSACSRRAPGI